VLPSGSQLKIHRLYFCVGRTFQADPKRRPFHKICAGSG